MSWNTYHLLLRTHSIEYPDPKLPKFCIGGWVCGKISRMRHLGVQFLQAATESIFNSLPCLKNENWQKWFASEWTVQVSKSSQPLWLLYDSNTWELLVLTATTKWPPPPLWPLLHSWETEEGGSQHYWAWAYFCWMLIYIKKVKSKVVRYESTKRCTKRNRISFLEVSFDNISEGSAKWMHSNGNYLEYESPLKVGVECRNITVTYSFKNIRHSFKNSQKHMQI